MLYSPNIANPFQELVTEQSIDDLIDGFHEIVENHSNPYFRRWAAQAEKAAEACKQLELGLTNG